MRISVDVAADSIGDEPYFAVAAEWRNRRSKSTGIVDEQLGLSRRRWQSRRMFS
jgi:hypothetical protein